MSHHRFTLTGVNVALALKHVNVVDLQALQALLHSVKDVLHRSTVSICPRVYYDSSMAMTHLAAQPLLVDDAKVLLGG